MTVFLNGFLFGIGLASAALVCVVLFWCAFLIWSHLSDGGRK